jgi:hypothetical protein
VFMEVILRADLTGHGQGLFKPFMTIWLGWFCSVK